jgi:hypothetical protein
MFEERTEGKLNILMSLLFCEIPTTIFTGILRVLVSKTPPSKASPPCRGGRAEN